MNSVSLLITAAGHSTRFGENKLLVDIEGKPLLIRSLESCMRCSWIEEVVIATRAVDIDMYRALCAHHHIPAIVVEGGTERIISVYQAALASTGKILLTHDGARPITSKAVLEDLLQAVKATGAAMTAIPPTATIKQANPQRIITHSLPRENTWIAQTPQGFYREILLSAFKQAIDNHYFYATDDSEIIALQGHPIQIVMGDPKNIKITLPSDLPVIRNYYQQENAL